MTQYSAVERGENVHYGKGERVSPTQSLADSIPAVLQVRLYGSPALAVKGQPSIKVGLCPSGRSSLFVVPRGLI